MDRKQKIMRLIIDNLKEQQGVEYNYTGAVTTMDPNVISMEFTARKGNIRGEFNIWGMIDVPLQIKAQYDSRSLLNEHAAIREQIEHQLQAATDMINKTL